jgi:hypothetical protein
VKRSKLTLETYLELEHIQTAAPPRAGAGRCGTEPARPQRRIRLRCQHYFAACRVVSETDRR